MILGFSLLPGPTTEPSKPEQTDPTTMSPEFEIVIAKRRYAEDRLENNYPFLVTIPYVLITLALGLAAVALHTIMVVDRIDFWQVCYGFVGGAISFALVILNLTLSNNLICLRFVYLILYIFFYSFLSKRKNVFKVQLDISSLVRGSKTRYSRFDSSAGHIYQLFSKL